MGEREQINLRIPIEEVAAFRAAAEAVGLDLTTWFRMLGRYAAGLPTMVPTAPPELRPDRQKAGRARSNR